MKLVAKLRYVNYYNIIQPKISCYDYINNNLFSYPSGMPKKYQKIIKDAETLLETAEKRVNFRNNNSDSFLYSHKAYIINAY